MATTAPERLVPGPPLRLDPARIGVEQMPGDGLDFLAVDGSVQRLLT